MNRRLFVALILTVFGITNSNATNSYAMMGSGHKEESKSVSSIDSQAFPNIPKKIHFIWIGKNIPEVYINNIRSFVARNPDYQVNLWVDRPSRFYQTAARMDSGHFELKLRNINEVVNEMPQKLVSYMNRERVGLYPNFASASDILRVYILDKEGGIYIDTDLKTNELEPHEASSFDEKIFQLKLNHTQHGISVNGFGKLKSQHGILFNNEILSREDNRFKYNNNVMASVAGSPYLKAMEGLMLEGYEQTNPKVIWKTKRIPWNEQTPIIETDRFKETLRITGPDMLFKSITLQLSQEIHSLSVQDMLAFVQSMPDVDYKLKRNRNENDHYLQFFLRATDYITQFQMPLRGIIDRCDNTWLLKKRNFKNVKASEFEDSQLLY